MQMYRHCWIAATIATEVAGIAYPGTQGTGAVGRPLKVHELERSWRALLNEREARLWLRAHQTLDRFGRRVAVGRASATRSRARLAGSIVVSRKSRDGISPRPLNRLTSIAPRPVNPDFSNSVLVRIVARVKGARSLRQPIERRDSEIEMTFLDQFRRLSVEESDQERGDMGAIDVRVGHDDNLVVAEVRGAVVSAGAGAERLQ